VFTFDDKMMMSVLYTDTRIHSVIFVISLKLNSFPFSTIIFFYKYYNIIIVFIEKNGVYQNV